MSITLSVSAAGRSHVGLVRSRNEDGLYVGDSMVAVADGLGGHVAGDVASATAIDTLKVYDRGFEPPELHMALGRAVQAVNLALRQRITVDPALAGMGTTLVVMLWSGSTCALANLGDSRAYRLRANDHRATRITEDHIYKHLVAAAATVPSLPERLARFLDGRPDGRSPDITTWHLEPGDRFLLCSDGLSTYVPHELIDDALCSRSTPSEAVDRLVDLGIDHGGHDNITAAVIDVNPV